MYFPFSKAHECVAKQQCLASNTSRALTHTHEDVSSPLSLALQKKHHPSLLTPLQGQSKGAVDGSKGEGREWGKSSVSVERRTTTTTATAITATERKAAKLQSFRWKPQQLRHHRLSAQRANNIMGGRKNNLCSCLPLLTHVTLTLSQPHTHTHTHTHTRADLCGDPYPLRILSVQKGLTAPENTTTYSIPQSRTWRSRLVHPPPPPAPIQLCYLAPPTPQRLYRQSVTPNNNSSAKQVAPLCTSPPHHPPPRACVRDGDDRI